MLCRRALRSGLAFGASRRAYAVWNPPPPMTPEEATRPKADDGRVLRDEAIPHAVVQLVHPQTRALLPPAHLSALLGAMDRDTHWLELVARAGPAPPGPPLVRLLNKKAVYAADRAAQKRGPGAVKRTELQLTWHVAEPDLAHKLRKARAELVQGRRVDLVFALKSKATLPPPDARAALLAKATELLQGVAVEWEPRTEERTHTIIHLERDPKLPLRATLSDFTGKPSPLDS